LSGGQLDRLDDIADSVGRWRDKCVLRVLNKLCDEAIFVENSIAGACAAWRIRRGVFGDATLHEKFEWRPATGWRDNGPAAFLAQYIENMR